MTPKLPKRIPSVLSAEEMNNFLNQLAAMEAPASSDPVPTRKRGRAAALAQPQEPTIFKEDETVPAQGSKNVAGTVVRRRLAFA